MLSFLSFGTWINKIQLSEKSIFIRMLRCVKIVNCYYLNRFWVTNTTLMLLCVIIHLFHTNIMNQDFLNFLFFPIDKMVNVNMQQRRKVSHFKRKVMTLTLRSNLMSEGPDYEFQFDHFLVYDIETRTQPLWASVSSSVKTINDNCLTGLRWGLKLML